MTRRSCGSTAERTGRRIGDRSVARIEARRPPRPPREPLSHSVRMPCFRDGRMPRGQGGEQIVSARGHGPKDMPGLDRTLSRDRRAGRSGEHLGLGEVPGLGERGERLRVVEVLGLEADHVGGERLVHLGLDVDVAHADLARLRIQHEPERDRHEPAGLDRDHRVAAALEQEARRPVAEAAAVLDVVRAGRRAAQLVAEVLGDDRHVDAARPQARGHAILDERGRGRARRAARCRTRRARRRRAWRDRASRRGPPRGAPRRARGRARGA